MRICSLLPSATEMVFALGAGDCLVGVTHECDYPPETASIPRVTRSLISPGLASEQIDSAVTRALDTAGSLYELDVALLDKLQPDLILTQRLCDVCAVSFDRVQDAVKGLKSKPDVMNLEPHLLADILDNIRTVGRALGRLAVAETLVRTLETRIDAVRHRSSKLLSRPRVFCMEWVDPPYCGGHWMGELVEIAGGMDELSNLHRPSSRIPWSRVMDFAPEIIVLTCCGFALDRCRQEAGLLACFEGLAQLPAARTGRIFATDGSAFFSRPGPRIVDGLEILAHLIHPEAFAAPPLAEAFCSVDPSGVAALSR